jgi:hypothetical protein
MCLLGSRSKRRRRGRKASLKTTMRRMMVKMKVTVIREEAVA